MSNIKKLPLSGSEPLFKYEPWGTKGRRSNNCYAYAVGDYEEYRPYKSVPGDRAGRNIYSRDYTKCGSLKDDVIADNPGKVYSCKANDKCKKGYYKIMMVVAPNYGDFHFYKQHGEIEYKVREGDTCASIARDFGVPVYRIRKNGRLVNGCKIRFKANMFSHKRGWATGPLLRDAKGNTIKDPRKASRNYGNLNYSKYCGSFCVKNRGIKVGNVKA
jgi:hypothetical protein